MLKYVFWWVFGSCVRVWVRVIVFFCKHVFVYMQVYVCTEYLYFWVNVYVVRTFMFAYLCGDFVYISVRVSMWL